MMWRPDQRQWIAIAVTFVTALYAFTEAAGRARYPWEETSFSVGRETWQVIRWFVLVGGGLVVWWLEGRRDD